MHKEGGWGWGGERNLKCDVVYFKATLKFCYSETIRVNSFMLQAEAEPRDDRIQSF